MQQRMAATVAGHPAGLAILCATQLWERFSYYGMRALLVLYLTEELLQPRHAANVLGYATLQTMLEFAFGPMSVQAMSSQIYGMYTALVFLTPLAGGILADRLLGQHRAVFLGGALIAAGHALMAFEATFLLALAAIIAGSGLFTPNIAAQVGMLYTADDPRRGRAYSLFYVGINVGGFLAPLVCGTLGEIYGWHVGFSVAAIGMCVGLAIYALGRRHLQPATPAPILAIQPATSHRFIPWTMVLVVMAVGVLFWAAIEQLGNVLSLWLRDASDLKLGDDDVRVTWFQSLNPLFILLGTPVLIALWSRLGRTGREPSTLTKMATGCAFVAGGYLLLSAVAGAADAKPHFLWTVLAILLLTLGELHLSPTSWSLFSRLAPPGRESLLMGLWLLPLFAGSYLAGLIGGYWELMSHTGYWLVIAAMAAAGGLVLLALRLTRPDPVTS